MPMSVNKTMDISHGTGTLKSRYESRNTIMFCRPTIIVYAQNMKGERAILPADLYIFPTAFWRKTPKNCRALHAPCFGRYLMRKTPFWGLRSDDTKIKKLLLLFFPPPCLCWRAQRAEIFIFPWNFSSGTVSERR